MAKKYEILDAADRIEFHKINELINEVIGTDYKAWMQAVWPSGNGNDTGKFRLWFPKLAKMKNWKLVPTAFDCINTISDDWNEVVYDDLKNREWDMSAKFKGYELIFAKDPEGAYVFRGVFIKDTEKSRPNHDVSKRIATRVKLIGDPVYDIELLDNVESAPISDNINEPIAPKRVMELEGGSIRYVCGRCDKEFIKAPRCPECGQLVKQ